MVSAIRLLLVMSVVAFASGHYGKPPCQSDETSFSLPGTGGELCAPKCGTDDACPMDLPPGDIVKPRCALNGVDGQKYCALTCYFGKCPTGASCKWPSGAIVGYCVYPTNEASTGLNSTIIDEQKLNHEVVSDELAKFVARPLWNISAACSSLCQPDPDYSRSSWCKHKDPGCCVEVNPNWDKVPGWKHMTDFCDKLCRPDGPGSLAMCEPPKEFVNLVATDPLDALDKFYESHPSACSDRIGDWAEAYCQPLLAV